MVEKDVLGGLIRLHVLYHASREPTFGQGLMDELGHHGYKLSPGTLYPVLHALERTGYLVSRNERSDGRLRRTYVTTAAGDQALRVAKAKVWELFREFFEDELRFGAPTPRVPRRAISSPSDTVSEAKPRAAARQPAAGKRPARPVPKTARRR